MNSKEFKRKYIDHYLLLENDFKKTFDYVSVERNNYDTYSAMYLKLILSIGSEIDILKKLIAKLLKPGFNEKKDDPNAIIICCENNFRSLEVKLRREEFVFKPWDYPQEPDWWTVYNEIKHNRLEKAEKFDKTKQYYQYANLQNTLLSLGALFSLEMYAYRLITIKNGEKQWIPVVKTLFSMNNLYWENKANGNGTVINDGTLYLSDD